MEDKLKSTVDPNADPNLKKRSEYDIVIDENYKGIRNFEFIAYKDKKAGKFTRMFGKWNKRYFTLNLDNKEFYYKDKRKAHKCKLLPLQKLTQVKKDKGLSKKGRVVTLFSRQRLINIKFITDEDLDTFVQMLGAVIHLEDNLPLYEDASLKESILDALDADPERREAERKKLQEEINIMKKSLGMGLKPVKQSSNPKPRKKKQTDEEKELEFLKMQQSNLEKQIEKLKSEKNYEEYGEEESEEELEFEDDDDESDEEEEEQGIKESAVLYHKTEEDMQIDDFPTEKEVNQKLVDYNPKDKSRISFGYQGKNKFDEDKSLMKATMFRPPGDPSRFGDRPIGMIPNSKKNVFKRSEIVDEDEERGIQESQILQRKVTETNEDDAWKF